MSAQRKMRMHEAAGYETAPLKKSPRWQPTVIETTRETAVAATAEVKGESTAKNVALFLAAPLIGLAYLLAMPAVALGALLWMGDKALLAKVPVLKTIALVVAAPFVGLAFIVVAPIVGLGALGWAGTKCLATR